MELDIVTYDPQASQLLHIEASLDANSWDVRETRFTKKFNAGRKYIFTDLFPWLPPTTPLTQRAILVSGETGMRRENGLE